MRSKIDGRYPRGLPLGPLGYRTLIFDLMGNLCIHNACIHNYSINEKKKRR